MKEWTIIGGGIQGAAMAVFLRDVRGICTKQLAVIDPASSPLQSWKTCTSSISMPFLRSPSVHHLDVGPFSLEKFAKKNNWDNSHFLGIHSRPSLSLFNAHSDALLEKWDILSSWVTGTVAALSKKSGSWLITLQNGEVLESRHVVLAAGMREHLFIPKWAEPYHSSDVRHIFDPSYTNNTIEPPITIVGGGISSAHAALKWSRLFPGRVTLIRRHPARIHAFDSDPGWQGPRNMAGFSAVSSYQKRRELIKKARHSGSMPKEIHIRLKKAVRTHQLHIIEAEPEALVETQGKKALYSSEGELLSTASTILLATGFSNKIPGHSWLEDTINKEQLTCSGCGFPIVSPEHLEWDHRLHTMGALAELEMGPTARNIAGARRAAARIVQAE